ncbi:MAG: hypothetical protein SO471_11220 [Anaerobutyricum hallii]|nr:hypothetical protein [Anaerobutyricum hallii]
MEILHFWQCLYLPEVLFDYVSITSFYHFMEKGRFLALSHYALISTAVISFCRKWTRNKKEEQDEEKSSSNLAGSFHGKCSGNDRMFWQQ